MRGDDERACLTAQMMFQPEGCVEVLFHKPESAISIVHESTEARAYEEIRWLVQEEHVTLDQQAAGEGAPGLPSARKRAERSLDHVLREAEAGEDGGCFGG